MTVVESLSAASPDSNSYAILSDNRDVAVRSATNVMVDYTKNCPREWFTKRELAWDVAAGKLGRLRPHYAHLFDPAIDAFRGLGASGVLLYEGHYAATSLPLWERVRSDAPVVLYVHNPLSRTYGKRELRRLVSHADALIFCADHLMQDFVSRTGPPSLPLEVVHNGVDPYFLEEPETEPDESEILTILFAGQVAEHKGVHVLIDALARLEVGARRVRAIIAGSSAYDAGDALSTYERDLRRRAAASGCEILFLPFVPKEELRNLYWSSSVVVVPSIWKEPFGLVALEALATGTAVIASQTPGLVEACGTAALYATPGSTTELSATIGKLLSDEDLRMALGAAGRERAKGFSWERAELLIRRVIDDARAAR